MLPESKMNQLISFSILLFTVASSAHAATPSPYVGQETRGIKALSETEVSDYLAGRGMGLAKAAELNRYPGPRHVLELAAELLLSADQRQQVEAIHSAMQTRAIRIGERLLAKERELDRSFSAAEIAEKSLKEIVTEIARLQGELRYVHLQAHLAVRPVLTAHQLARYDALRGYATKDDTTRPHSH